MGFLIGHGEVLPSPNNKVTLSDKSDRWDIPMPHINCKWGENEKAMVSHMNFTIEEIVKATSGQILPLKKLKHIAGRVLKK